MNMQLLNPLTGLQKGKNAMLFSLHILQNVYKKMVFQNEINILTIYNERNFMGLYMVFIYLKKKLKINGYIICNFKV